MAKNSKNSSKDPAAGAGRLERVPVWGIAVVLGLIAAGLFWEAQYYPYFIVDDGLYTTRNDVSPQGLSLSSVWTAFTTGQVSNYHPITMLTFMAEREFFDSAPRPAHLINVLLHAANTVLLFYVLRAMTRRVWPSALVAALFAIHPLHVEPVVWVSSRKDVLSTLFWFLSFLWYAGYVNGGGRRAYWLSFGALIMGLLSKQMLVTLPFLLCLLDYWPLRRYPDNELSVSRVWELVREKWPFFAAVAAFSVIAMLAQSEAGAVRTAQEIPFADRLQNMWFAYVAYLAQTVLPLRIQMGGYQTPLNLPVWQAAASFVVIVALSLLAIRWRKARPYFGVGWLWFLGTLVPVIGVVSIGMTYRADRYTYVPIIGLFIIGVWGAIEILGRLRRDRARSIAIVASVLVLGAYALISSNTIGLWKNNLTALKWTLALNDKHYLAGVSLGYEYQNRGRYAQAIEAYSDVLAFAPHVPEANLNMAESLIKIGNDRQATFFLRRYIEVMPIRSSGYLKLARTQMRLGEPEAARATLMQGLKALPDHPRLLEALEQLDAGLPEQQD